MKHSYMMGIIKLYCELHNMKWQGVSDTNVKDELNDRLELNHNHIDGDVLEKVSALNRLKRLIEDKPHLYHLAREAMIHTQEDNQQEVIDMALSFVGDNDEQV